MANFSNHSTFVENRVLDRVRSRISSMVDKREAPSMTVAVAQESELIWEEAFGWLDMENQIKATADTIYAIASLSKSLTATGLMVLVEQGRVKLHDPIEKYIAPVKLTRYEGQLGEPTVKQALNMTAGIPHGFKSYKERYQPLPIKELVSRYGIVVFPPGEVEEYSNFSYAIPQLIIETISGKSFAEFMSSEVFKPLGMMHTSVDQPHTEKVAARYRSDNTPIAYSYYFAPSGAAGFFSSAHDLIRFGMFHLKSHLPGQRQILSDKTLDAMHMDKDLNLSSPIMALGWGSIEFGKDLTWLVSNGGLDGATSMLSLVPSAKLAVVCLTNMTSPSRITDQIAIEITDALVPGFAGKVETFMKQYESAQAPYKPTSKFIGEWKGTIKAAGSTTSIMMTFSNDGSIKVNLSEQAETTLDNASVKDEELEGEFQGKLPNDEDSHSIQTIRIHLIMTKERMYGSAMARFHTEQGTFMLPYYTSLQRV